MTANKNNAMQHGLNAAQANVADSQEQQQVQELSSQLSGATNTTAANNAMNNLAASQAAANTAMNNLAASEAATNSAMNTTQSKKQTNAQG